MDERQLEMIETAADWADRYDDLDEAGRRELARWLEQSPEHGRTFARMRQVLQDGALAEALESTASVVEVPIPELPRQRPSAMRPGLRRTGQEAPGLGRRQALAAGLAALAVVPLGSYFLFRNDKDVPASPLRFASAVGKRRHFTLPDGSGLLLDAASSVAVHFTADMRAVELERGAARFDVCHDAARPFEVRTPGASMTALGTSFSVDRLTGASELRVFSGRVRMAADGHDAFVVPAREWALFDGSATSRGNFDAETRPDWQNDWLDADSMRLGFAIERLARYSETPIRLGDPALASRTFSGRFRLDRPEQSLALIGALFGLEASRRADGIYLVTA